MAQGILKFDLADAFEFEHFVLATHASTLYSTIIDIDRKLREEVKYKGNKQAEEIREMIRDMLFERNLHYDMLS